MIPVKRLVLATFVCKRLGGNRGVVLTRAARKAGRDARTVRAIARASDLAPVLTELREAGIASLGGIARALTKRGSPKLAKARKSAIVSIKALADQRAANVLPVIREIRRAGATSLHDRFQQASRRNGFDEPVDDLGAELAQAFCLKV
jgi:hypothetical protein